MKFGKFTLTVLFVFVFSTIVWSQTPLTPAQAMEASINARAAQIAEMEKVEAICKHGTKEQKLACKQLKKDVKGAANLVAIQARADAIANGTFVPPWYAPGPSFYAAGFGGVAVVPVPVGGRVARGRVGFGRPVQSRPVSTFGRPVVASRPVVVVSRSSGKR